MPIPSEAGLRQAVADYIASGRLLDDLARRVAVRTVSSDPGSADELRAYLERHIAPDLDAMGFAHSIVEEPDIGRLPYLIARRHEGDGLPTLLLYGHGDVVRADTGTWTASPEPWVLTRRGDRLYGRGTADNKGQHSVNLAALSIVLALKGRLGFNVVLLMEMGEECGSPGFEEFCRRHRESLRADILVASDGPRWSRHRPTLFLGARGIIDIEIDIRLRDRAYHNGNWGGWLSNAGAVLVQALDVLIDRRGRPRLEALATPAPARAYEPIFDRLTVEPEAGLPGPQEDWGDAQGSPAARLLNRNNAEIIAIEHNTFDKPVYAIGPSARALLQISYLPETDPGTFAPAINAALRAAGIEGASARATGFHMPASRTAPDHPLVGWAAASIGRWSGKEADLLPNFGGALPNWVFRDVLGVETLWIPHSYNGCAQHEPDEHALESILNEGLLVMAGLFLDIGESLPSGVAGERS